MLFPFSRLDLFFCNNIVRACTENLQIFIDSGSFFTKHLHASYICNFELNYIVYLFAGAANVNDN